MLFRASKRPQKFRTRKARKIIAKMKNACALVGIGGWPPISTWINPPPLGINGLHCIEFPHQLRKFMLNLAPGEPLALVQELPCFDNPIKLDPLLVSSIDLCIHNLISGCMFHELGLSMLVSIVLLFLRCPIMVENMVEGGPD
jgi:hypothetical protein